MIYPSKPTNFNPRFDVASCLVDHDNQYLLLQRSTNESYPNTWGPPGGRVDPGESPLSAVVRELAEETAIKLESDQVTKIGEYYVREPVNDLDMTYHLFQTNQPTKPDIVIDTEEHQDFQWVPLKQVLMLNLIHDMYEIFGIHQQYEQVLSPYWNHDFLHATNQAAKFEDLSDIAVQILRTMPQPTGWVCGPISNGGRGSFNENIKVFRDTIRELNADNKNTFDQTAFEHKLLAIGSYEPLHNKGIKLDLLNGFYRPTFESGLVHNLYFIPGWESSDGARWEHAQAERLNLNIEYL